jgi:hypothetical protein
MLNVLMLIVAMPSVVMLNVTYKPFMVSECCYAEYHFAEYRYAKYRYAECRGAVCNE